MFRKVVFTSHCVAFVHFKLILVPGSHCKNQAEKIKEVDPLSWFGGWKPWETRRELSRSCFTWHCKEFLIVSIATPLFLSLIILLYVYIYIWIFTHVYTHTYTYIQKIRIYMLHIIVFCKTEIIQCKYQMCQNSLLQWLNMIFKFLC